MALDGPVAMIKDDRTSVIPFDNSIVSCHTYDSRIHPWTVRKEIPLLAEWVRRAGQQERNALWRHFGHEAGRKPLAREAREPGASDPEFHAAVAQLVGFGGLARRRWDFDLGLDPPRRAVRLTLAAMPSEFLQVALYHEAGRLGLTLELAVRLTPRPPRTGRPR